MLQSVLSDFVYDLRLENVPEPVLQCARRAFADTVGVTVAGSTLRQPEMIAGALGLDLSATGAQLIVGRGYRNVSLSDAVLINAAAAHSMEYNDLFFGLPGHPSAVLVPALLNTAAGSGAGGKRLMEAYIAGFEVLARINEALMPLHHEKGFHSTSTAGVIGAAAAVSKLLGYDRRGIDNAISIACTLACGLRRNFGTFANSLHVGNAASGGVRAALYSGAGMTCAEGLLTLTDGYMSAFYGSMEKLDRLCSTLGQQWAFESPGLLIKKYPACFSTYQAIDAALSISAEVGTGLENVAFVECLTSEINYMSLPAAWAGDVYGERFCVPYCVLAALEGGRVDRQSFKAENLRCEQFLRLKDNFKYGVCPELAGREGYGFTEVSVRLRSGSTASARAFPNKGERVENWDGEALKAKFLECTRGVIDEPRASELYRSCSRIDEAPELSEFYKMLIPKQEVKL